MRADEVIVISDCAALPAVLAGDTLAGVPNAVLSELHRRAAALSWRVVASRDQEPLLRALHHRCHRAALAALRARRDRRARSSGTL